MPVNKKSLENLKKGKKFSSTNPPKNPGRRPNVYARYIRDERVSLDDQRALFSSLLTYNADEIDAILKSKDKPPVGMVLLLKAIASDLKSGVIVNYEKLMDRTHGKPIQSVEVSDKRNDIPDDPAERKALAEKLRKELGIAPGGKGSAKGKKEENAKG